MRTRLFPLTIIGLVVTLGIAALAACIPTEEPAGGDIGILTTTRAIYAGKTNGTVYISTDDGANWAAMGGSITGSPNFLYGHNYLFATTDAAIWRWNGSSWDNMQSLSPQYGGQIHACGTGAICVVASDWDGTQESYTTKIWRSTNDTTWSVTATLPCWGADKIQDVGTGYVISAILCDDNYQAGLGGDYGSNVYTSSDGITWTRTGQEPWDETDGFLGGLWSATYNGTTYRAMQQFQAAGDQKGFYTSDPATWSAAYTQTLTAYANTYWQQGTTALWIQDAASVASGADLWKSTNGTSYTLKADLANTVVGGQVTFGPSHYWYATSGGILHSDDGGDTWSNVLAGNFDAVTEYIVEVTTPTPTPTPVKVWISEIYGGADKATPCVNWNLRNGCGAGDDFFEVSVGNPAIATPRSIGGVTFTAGQCIYTFASDNRTGPIKVIYADDMLQNTPTATPTPTGATFTPTFTATPGGTPLATHTPTYTPTPWEIICAGLPITGTGTLKNVGGTVLETVVYTSTGGKSFGAVNWMTPPAGGRTWATGTPNPGTAATAVP